MLALVHPFNHSQDVAHRAPSSSSSSRSRQQSRKPILSSTISLPPSSSSSSSALASLSSASLRSSTAALLPSLQRHSTAPLAQVPKHQPREPSPPPKVVRAPTPDPPPSAAPPQQPPAFDIHSYPSPELLRLLASLLTQIAATNDKLEAASFPDPPSTTPTRTSLSTLSETDPPIWRTLTTASRTAISTPSCTLTFHARNIPTISLEAYLLRILKYCPTTNEVFLSLLVYFDRMSKLSSDATGRAFVIDSYNIHRLVIAGVTVASKFFSDVFYTNSRYAKVGGLPQAELNQLELQFLLLNDFRLVIPTDEMQRYAEQLVFFSNSTDNPLPPIAPVQTTPTLPSVTAPMQAMGAIDAYGGRIPGDEDETARKPLQHHYLQPGANGHLAQTQPHAPYRQYQPVVGPAGVSSYSNSSGSGSGSNKTPSVRPRYQRGQSDDASTETETETEETETDGGWTTDDEPTIRPAHSSAGSSSDDTRSLCSSISSASAEDTGDEGGDEGGEEDESVDDMVEMDVVDEDGARGDRTPESVDRGKDGDGERTPERRGVRGLGRQKLRNRDVDTRMASP